MERRRRREQRAGKTQVWRLLAGAREKRTKNMYPMVVTLEVSRLSGWLNTDALCRAQREAWEQGRHAGRGSGRA